ncbi:methylmalonyl-CoA mutase family protein [Hoyosella sp. YIM 151337]|uniref:methylmalonyl-CoA mutase family protein n=1 Tax=Hoyosella sp. YIM 151337 TaxID=2992742 RepID=UPI0022356460|nr:methylmalonyl-CoA mutase family protein [Hoyosella sp. YIM 151337]MCW4353137.1 methylmalonyl-CoA mutase family protein [Hoyosella sp. YIM 151337]
MTVESGMTAPAGAVPDVQAWRRAVAGVLAKSRRVSPDELGDRPEDLLAIHTYDGVTVNPLYTSLDAEPEHPLPGVYPFTRGGDALRDVNRGWGVAARFGAGTSSAADINEEILAALERGVSALWLTVGANGVPVESIDRALEGVLLDLAPLTLDAGAEAPSAAANLFAMLDARAHAGDGVTNRAQITIGLGAAPLTEAFTGDAANASAGLQEAVSLAGSATARDETIRAVMIDATAFHDAGSSDVQEIGAACAAGAEYVKAMLAAGLTRAQALGQIEFRFAATDDQFQTIAKLRAARQVWARVADVLGEPQAGNAPQHAVTSGAMMSQRDPWVNMLRTTVAAFGAGVGGADTVTVLPFDAALPAGALGVSDSFAERIARNTQLLLLEESNLGRVVDPAGGSWYAEKLTSDLALAAWRVLQDIDAAGGYLSTVESGWLRAEIESVRAAREKDIARRKVQLTGVNEFPDGGEKPLPVDDEGAVGTRLPRPDAARYAQPFENLRNRSDRHLAATGARPAVLLAPLGPLAEHNIRTTFIANLVGSGGIEAVNPGPVGLDGLAGAARSTAAKVAVVCGSDARYSEEAADAVRILRGAGVTHVMLAGSESAFPAATQTDTAATTQPDGYLRAGIDAVAVLSALLDTLGVQ